MQQGESVLINKKELSLIFLGYVAVSLVMPVFFRSDALAWLSYTDSALFCYGGIALRAFARQIYRKLQRLLPEHAKEIQAYKDDLSIFKWNTMIKPDFVEPLAEGFPRKDELMSELRFAYKLCRIWQIAMWVTLLLLLILLIVITAR